MRDLIYKNSFFQNETMEVPGGEPPGIHGQAIDSQSVHDNGRKFLLPIHGLLIFEYIYP